MSAKFLLPFLLTLVLMEPACSGALPGNALPAIAVRDLNGQTCRPLAITNKKAIVLIFITDDCPISNSYAPEINRLCRTYTPRKIGFYLVETDPATTAATARKHAREYDYPCPVLLDPGHKLVQRAGATVTPEVAVFALNGQRLYRGRIDNKYADFGQIRPQPTVHDLQAGLEAILARKPILPSETKAIGCFI